MAYSNAVLSKTQAKVQFVEHFVETLDALLEVFKINEESKQMQDEEQDSYRSEE